MPQFDLRYADVKIQDGLRVLGAVNQPSTPPANGDTHITVDGFSAAIPAGAMLKIAGNTQTFTVVSTTGGATPTAITFTPAITTAGGIPVDNGVVTVGPNFIFVKIGDGTLQYTEKKKFKYIRNKGRLDGVIDDDDETMDLNFEFTWEFITGNSGDIPTVEECLKKQGNASAWVNSATDPCTPYAVDVIMIYTPPCVGVNSETHIFPEFRYENLDHSAKDSKVSVKGQCNVTQATHSRP